MGLSAFVAGSGNRSNFAVDMQDIVNAKNSIA